MKHAVFSCLGAIAVLMLSFGCETESSDSASVTVTPSFVKLTIGASVTLSVSGGWDYHWSLQDTSCGSLSSSSGSSVVYTATRGSVTQYVTLTSGGSSTFRVTIAQGDDAYTNTVKPASTSSGSSSSSSSSSSSGSSSGSGSSTVVVKPSTTVNGLTIQPGAAKVKNGASISLSVSGGANYTWSLSNNSVGSLNKTTGASVSYTAKDNTSEQTITVRATVDGATREISATITHVSFIEGDDITDLLK